MVIVLGAIPVRPYLVRIGLAWATDRPAVRPYCRGIRDSCTCEPAYRMAELWRMWSSLPFERTGLASDENPNWRDSMDSTSGSMSRSLQDVPVLPVRYRIGGASPSTSGRWAPTLRLFAMYHAALQYGGLALRPMEWPFGESKQPLSLGARDGRYRHTDKDS